MSSQELGALHRPGVLPYATHVTFVGPSNRRRREKAHKALTNKVSAPPAGPINVIRLVTVADGSSLNQRRVIAFVS